MHDIFMKILSLTGFVIESIGFIIIVISVLKSFYKIAFITKFDFEESHKDVSLSTGLSVALEFFLAAEIIKTITLRDQSELVYIGVLILIRILMTVVINWELKQKENLDT
ncbi:MAG: DUF1622 domain-containing protein [Peptoniphilaceae bacterium]|nr:DUF1622 domain-containing protein [Peptoniphilaceae bacterium]MDY6018503.1 DUF1622 domain-containing protein [Anaerococcus sp.]